MINSQWSILNMSGHEEKQNELISANIGLYPNHRGEDCEYRIDYGVLNYQLPAEDDSHTKVLERVLSRRTV